MGGRGTAGQAARRCEKERRPRPPPRPTSSTRNFVPRCRRASRAGAPKASSTSAASSGSAPPKRRAGGRERIAGSRLVGWVERLRDTGPLEASANRWVSRRARPNLCTRRRTQRIRVFACCIAISTAPNDLVDLDRYRTENFREKAHHRLRTWLALRKLHVRAMLSPKTAGSL